MQYKIFTKLTVVHDYNYITYCFQRVFVMDALSSVLRVNIQGFDSRSILTHALLTISICYIPPQFSTICGCMVSFFTIDLEADLKTVLILISFLLRSWLIWIYIVFKSGYILAKLDKGLKGIKQLFGKVCL